MTPSSTPFPFSSSGQFRLYERLNHIIGPGSAAMYRDAHRLLAETTPYASTTHLVFHLLREIESAVRHVLLPYDYASTVAQHASETSSPSSESLDQTGSVEKQPVQEELSISLPSLKCSTETTPDERQPEQGENHKQEIEAIVDRYHLPSSLAKTWMTVALRSKTGAGFAELAHRDALAMPRSRNAEFEQALQQFEAVLEQVLEAFERQSFHIFRLLDRLLAKAQPGRRDVTLFINRVPPNRVTYTYFFSRLENPRWLTLLAKKGVFAPPLMGLEEGRAYYDLWPQVAYLKRMAVDPPAQTQVLSLLLVAASSENPFVQRAIVEIGILLPAQLAVQLVPLIIRWSDLPDPYASFVTPLFEPFLEHLVQGDEGSAALGLLDTLLTQMSERDSYSERWEYEQLLVGAQPLLVFTHTRAFLHVLCRHLQREVYQHFIRFRVVDETDTTVQTRAQEASTLWQRTIAAGRQSAPSGTTAPLHLLVATIRQTVEQAITAQVLTLSEAVSLLKTHPGQIFRRLALYTISQFAQHDPTLTRTWIVNHDFFADPDIRSEYMLLVREGLSMLSAEEQELLLQWIKDGPPPELLQWPEYTAEGSQQAPSEDQVQQRKAQWQWRWLEYIGDALPQAWHLHYDDLTKAVGAGQTPPVEDHWIWQSWPYALSFEAYKAMPLDQFMEELTLSAAEPETRSAGLSSLLTAFIADTPACYADQVTFFQEQPPEVVAAALRGFTQATKRQQSFDWSALLPLCIWVVEQRFALPLEEEDSPQHNQAWAEASKEVAVLLETGLHQSEALFSLTWQDAIWSMLETLVNDSYGLARRDSHHEQTPPWSLALNSTRGQALLAVIQYARWLWEDWRKAPTYQEADEEQWTLKQVPEVRLLLERFLVRGQDDTGVAHAVLGNMFPLLFHLDTQWTRQHQHVIFPHDEASQPSFDAAWEALMLRTPPSRKVLEALRGEYALAISHLQSNDDRQRLHEDPDARLASHLAVFVIRGDIVTKPIDPLLVSFFQRASNELRHEILSTIGRIFANDREHLPEQAVEQCQHLWEWRITQVNALPDPHQSAPELAAFGWWIFKDIFPAHWSAEHLMHVLQWSKRLDMSSFVVHRLAVLISQEPDLVIQCLSHLVKGDTTSWGSTEWNEAVRTILVEALQQQEETIQAQARAVISILMMQGHTQYRELVPQSDFDL